MDLINFFETLDYLKENMLPPDLIINEKVIYYGVRVYPDLPKGLAIKGDEKNHYLIYAKVKNPFDLKCLDVTKHIHYLNQIKNLYEDSKTRKTLNGKGIKSNMYEILILEAFQLYDEISKYEHTYFKVKLLPINIIAKLLEGQTFTNSDPSVILFKNNPLLKDILIEQFKYFIKHYIYTTLKSKNYATRGWDIENKLKPLLSVYSGKEKSFKTSLLTGEKNKELEDFLFQLPNSFN